MANGLKKIPGGITIEDFVTIKDLLRNLLAEAEVRQVIMRLNRTEENDPCPVFVGWVEDEGLAQARTQNGKNDPDPGLFRFGDTNYSKVYNETLCAAQGMVNDRNWEQSRHEKDYQSKVIGPDAGIHYQKYIAIIAGGHYAGTLSAGLSAQPDSARCASIDDVMRRWATGSDRTLVSFLANNFALGGPAI